MKKKVKSTILSIDPQVCVDIDPVFHELLDKVFTWSNTCGLLGNRVCGFKINNGSEDDSASPSEQRHTISCTIFSEDHNG